MVPSPLGVSVHGEKRNDFLEFNYIKISPSNTEDNYVLMLREDIKSYFWLIPLIKGNCPTNFKNETVRPVSRGL